MDTMKEMIQLNTINDVQELCNLAGKNQGDVMLTSGRFNVDAKSLMGIMSLNLSKPVELTAYSPFDMAFTDGIKKFIVQ